MDLCPSSMLNSPLLKPLHEYTCTLSLKLPQFCCSGRRCFGKDPECFPYLLKANTSPSFRSFSARLCHLAQHLTRAEPSFQVTQVQVQISSCKNNFFFSSCKDTSPTGSGPTLSTSFFKNYLLFVFCCTASSLLHLGFLNCGEQELLFVGVAAFVAEHGL